MKTTNAKIDFTITEEFESIICGNPSCGIEFLLFHVLRDDDNVYRDFWPQSGVRFCPYCGHKPDPDPRLLRQKMRSNGT